MKTKSAILSITICLIAFNFCGTSRGADPVQLPSPRMEGGKPLMQVLKERRTTRAFADRKVSPETLSNLLWAAFGINRPDGRRTAPSARNWQEIDIYVSTADGFYLWDPVKNTLLPVLTRDARALTGTQDHAASAPVSLVYVADYSRSPGGGGYGLHQPERLSLLRVGRPGHRRPGQYRPGRPGQGAEAAPRPEDHPGPVGGLPQGMRMGAWQDAQGAMGHERRRRALQEPWTSGSRHPSRPEDHGESDRQRAAACMLHDLSLDPRRVLVSARFAGDAMLNTPCLACGSVSRLWHSAGICG